MRHCWQRILDCTKSLKSEIERKMCPNVEQKSINAYVPSQQKSGQSPAWSRKECSSSHFCGGSMKQFRCLPDLCTDWTSLFVRLWWQALEALIQSLSPSLFVSVCLRQFYCDFHFLLQDRTARMLTLSLLPLPSCLCLFSHVCIWILLGFLWFVCFVISYYWW